MKKILFLVFTLAIPVAIFLFLKIFGANEFDVPVLFENGIPDCESSSSPHVVPQFEYIGETEKNLSSEDLKGFLVFGVLNGNSNKYKEQVIELVRIQDAFYEIGSPKFVLLADGNVDLKEKLSELAAEIGLDNKNYEVAILSHEVFMGFMKCGIALIDEKNMLLDNLLLVDPERKIRGIYNTYDLEQTDQLILELKILKQIM